MREDNRAANENEMRISRSYMVLKKHRNTVDTNRFTFNCIQNTIKCAKCQHSTLDWRTPMASLQEMCCLLKEVLVNIQSGRLFTNVCFGSFICHSSGLIHHKLNPQSSSEHGL